MNKLSTEEFIKRAKEIHREKYDYSKKDFINFISECIKQR